MPSRTGRVKVSNIRSVNVSSTPLYGASKNTMKRLRGVVKTTLRRQQEKKQAYFNVTSQALYGYANNATNFQTVNIYPLTPYSGFTQITQGLGDADRIGDDIRTYKAKLKIVLYPEAYNASTNPLPECQDVRIMIVKPRGASIIADIQNTVNVDFFNTGNTSVPIAGNLVDMTRTINNDKLITFYDKIHKIGFAGYTGTGSQASYQYMANNDYKLNKIIKLDVTKWIPKLFKYNDNGPTPNTHHVYIIFCPVNATGTVSGSAANQYKLLMNMTYEFNYTDS